LWAGAERYTQCYFLVVDVVVPPVCETTLVEVAVPFGPLAVSR
jgi:hypothetical protein